MLLPSRGSWSLGLIVNRRARAVRRHYLQRPFWLGALPEAAVRVTESLEELEAALTAFGHSGVSVIAALGGDGTVHHLVDAMIRHYPRGSMPMVLGLAGGTMNGIVRSLGTGGEPGRMLSLALSALARGQPAHDERRLLEVTEPGGTARYGFSFATGLIYRAFETYYRSPDPGMPDALRASLLPLRAAIFGGSFYEELRLDLETDTGSWLPDPPHSILASVLTDPLLWFRPFGPGPGPGHAFHLAATSMRPVQIAPRLWSIFRGSCRHPALRIGSCREAHVRGETGYLMDGDLYARTGRCEVGINLGPPIRFLTPVPRRPDRPGGPG